MSTKAPTKRVLVIWPDGRETEHRIDAYDWLLPGDVIELWEGLGAGGLIRRVEMEIESVNGHIITVKRPYAPIPVDLEMGPEWG